MCDDKNNLIDLNNLVYDIESNVIIRNWAVIGLELDIFEKLMEISTQ